MMMPCVDEDGGEGASSPLQQAFGWLLKLVLALVLVFFLITATILTTRPLSGGREGRLGFRLRERDDPKLHSLLQHLFSSARSEIYSHGALLCSQEGALLDGGVELWD